MTTLITGASGFIGSHLARRLLDDGQDVVAVVRQSRQSNDRLDPRMKTIVDDGNPNTLIDAVSGVAPTRCIHLATHFAGAHKPDDIAPLVESNIAFGMRLLEACSKASVISSGGVSSGGVSSGDIAFGDIAFVNVGTIWQHYEARAYSPVSLYGATKQAFTDIVRFYAEVEGLRVVNLELSDTYGAGDPRRKVVKLLMQAALDETTMQMSPGDQLIFLLHVDDVVEALLTANQFATVEAPSYGLPPLQSVSLKELVALIEQVIGRVVEVEFGAQPYRAREMMMPWHHSPTLPGWNPQIRLEQGLREVWDELR